MSLEHSPARCKSPNGASLNLLRGAPAIATFLGPQFNARIVRYLHENKKVKSIFQIDGTGPLMAQPDQLAEELLGQQSTEAA